MHRIKQVFELTTTAAVLAVAVYMVSSAQRSSAASAPTFIDGWETAIGDGIRIGPVTASVTVQEFVDFQCPFCRRAAPVMDSILSANSNVALLIYHLPLNMHPYARPAAVAVECAVRQNAARPFIAALFAGQDSLGQQNWLAYAKGASVPDPEELARCAQLPVDSFPRISQGLKLAERFGISGTPTFLINGRSAGRLELRSRVTEELQREKSK